MNINQPPIPLLQVTCTYALTSQDAQNPSTILKSNVLSNLQTDPIFPFINLYTYSNKTIPLTPLSPNTPFSEQSPSCFSVCHSELKKKEETDKRINVLRMILKSPKNAVSKPIFKKKVKCNCRKSGCLKMYCDCFRERGYCEDCNCIGCKNTPENDVMRNETMKAIKTRNPLAFEGLLAQSNAKQNNPSALKHIKGCRCKKSNCRKKYCECFQLGISCGADCSCFNCQNGKKGEEGEEEKKRKIFKPTIRNS